MSHVIYAYIAKPTIVQVACFLRELEGHGVSISHLGKSDPPRKFGGSLDDAVRMVFSGTDLVEYTFARNAARRLEFDFQINHDPRWTHSTVSASCDDIAVLGFVVNSAAAAFDSFITIRGDSDRGKEQPWEVVHVTESCPNGLRSRFVAA